MNAALKKLLKYCVGYVRCKKNHLKTDGCKDIYIGKQVKIAGGRRITVANQVSIRPAVELWCFGQFIHIGEGTDIGTRSRISIANSLEIGKNVLISPNVYITDCDHAYADIEKPIMHQGIVDADNRVVIKDNCYIGINSVVVGNITIGKGCVVGANSVVTKDVPDYCVAAGVPARVIKRYSFEKNAWERI